MKKLKLSACALGGLLIAALLAPSGGMAAQKQNKTTIKPSAAAHRYPKSARGAYDMSDGQIKSVTCHGRALDMVFDDSEVLLHLYSDNYFKVDFSAINFTPKGVMNPCKTIKGMYARVYFYHIKGHPKVGELVRVALRK